MNLRRISLNFVEIYIISIEFTYFVDKLEIITDEKTYNLEETYKERGKVIDDEFYVTLVK